MPNRLARERSPYLLQHANNPVDWYAWGRDAFEAARAADKPIFLSIGYSTCHWCHVMERESFEDAAMAKILNDHFVSIKVDREERPDVDRVYMTFVQATTGAGGWPMSVWLTPDLMPFIGGTYFPPTSRWGRPGFPDILMQIAKAWQEDRNRILRSAETVVERLREATGAGAAADRAPVAGRDALEKGIASSAQSFDARHGGFGGAPKFPRPSELSFLLAAGAVTGNPRGRAMAAETLRAMAMGGIHDHVGGGFHRYSVDAEWRVPHFEKMLYDQAQIVLACLETSQATGDAFYSGVAENTLDYVLRDLTAPDGAFYSAEDADSLRPEDARHEQPASGHAEARGLGPEADRSHPEKAEGAFYIWSAQEIDKLFADDAAIVRRRFGIEDAGNALSDPQGEFRGENILYIAQSIDDIAARIERSVDDVMGVLVRARRVMMDERDKRPRPHRDDKVIAAWNGLMIAAFAKAARVLVDSPERGRWEEAARRAATAVRTHLWRATERRLLRRYRDGEAAIDGFCEDYACVAFGLIELFQATGEIDWLEWALELTAQQTTLFFDERDGGWFNTTGEDSSVLLRLKEDYDGAEPAAASVAVRNLLVLGHLVSDDALVERAGRTLERYGSGLGNVVRVMPFMASNLALWHATFTQIVIAGSPAAEDTRALQRAAAERFLPASVTIPLDPARNSAAFGARLPWVAAMTARGGDATAYVCADFACQSPVTTPADLRTQLEVAAATRPSLY